MVNIIYRKAALVDSILVILLGLFLESALAKQCHLSQAKTGYHALFNHSSQSWMLHDDTSNSNLTNKTATTASSYKVQECNCSHSPPGRRFFCLENRTNQCAVSTDATTVLCFYEKNQDFLLKNTFTVIVLWYGALFIFFITTDNGEYSRDYLLSIICPGRNRRIAQRLADQERQTQNRLQAFATRRMQAFATQQQGQEQLHSAQAYLDQHQELVLKTRLYHSAHSPRRRIAAKRTPETPTTVISNNSFSFGNDAENDHRCSTMSRNFEINGASLTHHKSTIDDGVPCEIHGNTLMSQENDDSSGIIDDDCIEDDEIACSICLASVQDGEKIGALPCNHIFHSDCLKDWLRRRNVCPLCQAPNVAEARPSPRANRSIESINPHSPNRATSRVNGAAVEWSGTPVVAAFRVQQPSGQVRVIYRLDRPTQTRSSTNAPSLQEQQRAVARLFSVFFNNSELTPTTQIHFPHPTVPPVSHGEISEVEHNNVNNNANVSDEDEISEAEHNDVNNNVNVSDEETGSFSFFHNDRVQN